MLPLIDARQWNRTTALHLLNRAGFGGTPADVAALKKLGPAAAVESLVNFDKVPETVPAPDWAKPDPEFAEQRRKMQAMDEEERRKAQGMLRRTQENNMLSLREWWLDRMLTTKRPLQEKLTLFWHGHFATSFEKVNLAYFMWLQNETFRRNAAGNWRTLLEEVSRDPAMVRWLDNAQNRRERPNENYARELMELFTLGEGHYTEKDIQESARAFTGWSLDAVTQSFMFRRFAHDDGDKVFFGKTGNWDGSDIIRIILEQPQAARFIVTKLWRFFAAPNPPEDVVKSLAWTLTQSNWEFKPVLREMFQSRAFYGEKIVGTQVKSPTQWLVGACKSLECDLPPARTTTAALRTLGQSLFEPPNVKGWDGGIAWITTAALFNRYNFAGSLLSGTAEVSGFGRRAQLAAAPTEMKMEMTGEAMKMADTDMPAKDRREKIRAKLKEKGQRARPASTTDVDVMRLVAAADLSQPEKVVDTLITRLFVAQPTANDREALLAFAKSRPALPLTAPDVRELVHLMMSTPRYQLT
jgi:uncharacterized protein (DUF1800 family)